MSPGREPQFTQAKAGLMKLHFNHKSLCIRILFAMTLMMAIMVAFLLLLADAIIERGFREVEQREVSERVGQVANALDNSLAGLSQTARDYAFWDDTYGFVATGDPAYIEDNLTELFFLNNNVSYIALVSPSGQLIYSGAFDLENEAEISPPAVLDRLNGSGAWLAQPDEHAGELAGLLVLDEGPLLIAAQPILTSLGEGPSAGTLLMGRALNDGEIARLAELTRLPFMLHRLDDPQLPPELQSIVGALVASPSRVTMALDAQRILGATQVADLAGGPGVLLALELPREVYQLGQQASRDYMLVLLGVGLLFSVLVLWVIEVTVLRRMIALSRQVTTIEASRPEARVSVAGRDELGQLGEAINEMLARLAQAQQQLAASEQRYRHLIELSPDATIIHDGQRIRYSNAAGARLLGSETPAALVDQPVDRVIAAVAPRDDGAPLLSEHMLIQPDGSLIEVEMVALPFQERGAPATQVIVRNITERKQVEKALRSAKEAADLANRAKSQFLATMSHELRTPLAAIIGYAELLEQAVATAPLDELLHDIGRIRTAGAHLLALINDVLDLSKIEAGHMQVKATPLRLDLLLQAIIGTVEPLAARNGNRLELRGGANLGLMLSDEVRLRQILFNLLSNACKFTHEGDVTLEVQVLAAEGAERGERLRFAVHDTGIGIAPAQQSQLFRDFVQIDSSSTRRYGGTGLGLALSQRLARLLGGAITLVSEPRVGSTFTLDLPRNYAGGDDHDQADAPPLADVTPSLAEMADAESRIVLVIDDDPER